MMRHPLVQLLLVRLRTFQREPEALFWTFGFPLVLTLVLGIAFRPVEGEPIPIVVIEGPDADEITARLERDEDLAIRRATDASEARRLFIRGGALAIVEGSTERPVLHTDPTRPESRLAHARVERALIDAPLAIEDAPMREPGTRYVDFVVPGLVGMNVMTVCLWGIGWNVVESRSKKLLRRLAVTPMKRRHYLGAFLLAHVLLVLVTLAVVLGFAWASFGVGVEGRAIDYVVIVLLGCLAFSAMGVLLASRTDNVEVLSGMVNAASLLQLVASGVFFSTSRFPEWALVVLRGLPLTALVDALRAIALEGRGLTQLPVEVAVLTAWTILAGAIGVRIFRWS
ncbi:MAG: ABC transporter permease [Deltaproteobacteria bacterium]|nr:ABC transporter permease [Deltaproteobacteria bacterium]